MSTRQEKLKKLGNKEYRDAYVGEYLHTNIAYQVRALRKQRNWDQKKLADHAGMLQPRISAIENPSNSKLNLDTLLRLANAFDIALEVRFAAFSDLLRWGEGFSPDTFEVNSFDKDCYLEQPINKVPETDDKTSTKQPKVNNGYMAFVVPAEYPVANTVVIPTGNVARAVTGKFMENSDAKQKEKTQQ